MRHRAFGGDVVNLRTAQLLNSKRTELLHSLPFVRDQVIHTDLKSIRLVVDKARTAMPALVDWCKEQDIAIESIEEYIPPFDDVFIKLVKGVPSHA